MEIDTCAKIIQDTILKRKNSIDTRMKFYDALTFSRFIAVSRFAIGFFTISKSVRSDRNTIQYNF